MNTNESNSLKKTKVLVSMAIFTALVVVLQLLAGSIKIGPFSPSLVLVPIVIGAAVYGCGAGAWLGFVFGAVVLIACITGQDAGGYLMWGINPFMTAVICIGKGVAAGFAAGWIYRLLGRKNQIVGTVAAAIVCPVVNTGLFCLGATVAFKPLLMEWATAWWSSQPQMSGDVNLILYLILGMIGLNFLLEMMINVLLSPAVVRILKIRKNA